MNYGMNGMSKEERRRYIQEKLREADCTQAVFEENAVEVVLNAANGTHISSTSFAAPAS